MGARLLRLLVELCKPLWVVLAAVLAHAVSGDVRAAARGELADVNLGDWVRRQGFDRLGADQLGVVEGERQVEAQVSEDH